jgi:ABC-type dipeptide/oligopeptide/nickel transport system ATPase component
MDSRRSQIVMQQPNDIYCRVSLTATPVRYYWILTLFRHRLSTIMKADHILVVMNGEIIEEGSHQDLVHSKGKYHDLWSKQIFVKPATEQSRSRSPKKRDPSIINDLTPARRQVELARAVKTTEHEEPQQDDEQKEPKGGKKNESSHKREVSAAH